MAENSYREALTKWVDANSWPRPPPGSPDAARAILILAGVATSGTVFKFQSALGYFEVTAHYHETSNLLTSVRVELVVPGYTKETLLTGSDAYRLSTGDGKDLTFKIGKDVIDGQLSFKYVDSEGAPRSISMKYKVKVPFAGNLEDTIALSPAKLTSGFTTAELEAIPVLTPSELQLEEEKALAYSVSATDVVQTQYQATNAEQDLLVKFLRDFAKDGDKVVIETYYDESSSDPVRTLASVRKSNQYEVSVGFLGVFDLVGSVDPTSLSVAAALFVRVPIAGRVRITNIQGSLVGSTGVTVAINAVLAKGSATLTAEKSNEGKHVLFVSLALSVRFIGNITSGGKLRLLTLPF